MGDSNPRPSVPETNALSPELIAPVMATILKDLTLPYLFVNATERPNPLRSFENHHSHPCGAPTGNFGRVSFVKSANSILSG